jgi:hypothetical protein
VKEGWRDDKNMKKNKIKSRRITNIFLLIRSPWLSFLPSAQNNFHNPAIDVSTEWMRAKFMPYSKNGYPQDNKTRRVKFDPTRKQYLQ